ncbi:hypothetical protein XI03_37800 [Bradyrhizobium sp. CCBAU 65884]|nr:hypothetical protein [Bradyrhizobium sp. CCBAU 65884]
MLRRVQRRRQKPMAWNAASRGTQLLQTHLKQLSSMSQASQRPVARAAVTHSTGLQRRQPQS